MTRRAGAGLLGVVVALGVAAPASGDVAELGRACSTRDAADGNPGNGLTLPFRFCDDGVPEAGGRTPNQGASRALAVPQSYRGVAGLPAKAAAQPDTGADSEGHVALDADLSLPAGTPPPAGYPLMVLMHTCCSADKRNFEADTAETTDERWHYSNAWFATRGYAVLNYTARGFVDAQGHGSTGEAQFDSRRYEVNDFQHLACQLARAPDLDPGRPGAQRVDPRRVVISGGSYGAGLSWLALTDPTWSCAHAGAPGIDMRLAAAAPRYGWSDLLYSLVPNGAHTSLALPPTDPARASSKAPLGFPRSSILRALLATGKAGDPRTGGRTTFPPEFDRSLACLESTTPLEESPACTTTGVVPGLTDELLVDRSAYYQNAFFTALKRKRVAPVPVFSAGSSSSPLFGQVEHRWMAERLRFSRRSYPVQEYYGDIGDFTQNKAKEWVVATTLLNRFVDYYARPPGQPQGRRPAFDATVTLQICPANATAAFPADGPGPRYSASSFARLAPKRLRLEATGERTTTSRAFPNPHAANADPVANLISNGGRCPVETSPAGPGVAVYDFAPLASDAVMIGRPRVTVPHAGAGSDLQLDARLYEVLPDGSQVLVDRGVKRLAGANGTTWFDLNGNAWRFTKGHRLRLELAQDDDPYVKASSTFSTLTLRGVKLSLPVR